MRRIVRTLLVAVVVLGVASPAWAAPRSTEAAAADAVEALRAEVSGGGLAPRVRVNSPWQKDDTIRDAFRARGDLRKIVVENGRQQMAFTFRMQAKPLWDNLSTDRVTQMVFLIDWHGTNATPDRALVVDRIDNQWVGVILNRNQAVVCSRTGGVQQLTKNRFRITAPVEMCLGGPHLLRAAGGFFDDIDDSDTVNRKLDVTPNSGGYGPFIRLPGTRGRESASTGGWTVH